MPERATVEFDHHSEEFHDSRLEHWAELRRCPVAFNPGYGGFWVVSGYDEVNAVSRDEATFSSKFLPEPVDGVQFLGITGVPRIQGIPPAGIAEVDGPLHTALRRVLNPRLLPPAVDELRPTIQQAATWFLDQKIAEGAMDLVLDYANPVPAALTMQLLGLPIDGWEHYGEVFHAMIACRAGTPEYDHALSLIPGMVGELLGEAAERRQQPRGDLLSELVTLEVDGARLDDGQLTAVLWNLVGGGLDTTTSLTSLALHHLDAHPDLREQLIERPELISTATEEYLRFFSVNETLTRTVTKDTVLGGQELHRGDYVLISWLSANHDEAKFDEPEEVVLDRSPNPHLAFGVGPHRCIGMHLARTMFQVMLDEVLRRIPDYRVDRAATAFYEGNPELTGIVRMPATFTPGPVVGPAERPF